jgi:hypothetical protein
MVGLDFADISPLEIAGGEYDLCLDVESSHLVQTVGELT